MGTYDDITPEDLRASLVRAARLVLELEEDGTLLAEAPGLLELFGELRQMLFAYEVRCTGNLVPAEPEGDDGAASRDEDDPEVRESLRIVREALERQQELRDELEKPLLPDDEE